MHRKNLKLKGKQNIYLYYQNLKIKMCHLISIKLSITTTIKNLCPFIENPSQNFLKHKKLRSTKTHNVINSSSYKDGEFQLLTKPKNFTSKNQTDFISFISFTHIMPLISLFFRPLIHLDFSANATLSRLLVYQALSFHIQIHS